MKFILNVVDGNDFTAKSKAKADVVRFLNQEGFTSINVPFIHRFEKLSSKKIMNIIESKVSPKDTVVVSYPTYLGFVVNNKMLAWFKSNQVHSIAIIHDLDSVRIGFQVYRPFKNIAYEAKQLNKFDFVISSNAKMTAALKKAGLKTPTTDLKIFDYYHNEIQPHYLTDHPRTITFAGDLRKSKFVDRLSSIKGQMKFRLFGKKDNELKLSDTVSYAGVVSPEKLITSLDRGLGLVWDGPEINTAAGLLGNYLRFNNPHKTSLYLSAGLPVLIWSQAAISDFILENKLGLTVDSLVDLDTQLSKITDDELQEMHENALKIAEKLKNGYFVKSAVKTAMETLN